MRSIKELRLCARRGAKWLDNTKLGWRYKINPRTLDMFDCGDCVLGQVFGSFTFVLIKGSSPHLSLSQTTSLGFRVETLDELPGLRKAWLEVVKENP